MYTSRQVQRRWNSLTRCGVLRMKMTANYLVPCTSQHLTCQFFRVATYMFRNIRPSAEPFINIEVFFPKPAITIILAATPESF